MIELLPLRFQRKIVIPEGSFCWVWIGALSDAGYARVNVDGKNRFAHRVIYGILVEPIPEDLDGDHLCRVRACVNPVHVEPVTHRVNVLRTPGHFCSDNARKMTCPQGHSYADAILLKSGRRRCRTCKRAELRQAA